ncbi:hypothetical protein Lpp219_07366, partial [Lacticaseibacillus paracasei subsp. paracasei Lpp219]
NRQFLINGNGDIREFRPNDGANEALQVHTLTAVVDYIGKVSERSASPLIVQVVDENSVFVLGELDDFGNREVLIKAKAMHPCYPYGQWLDSESFIIALQAQFMTTEDGKVLLKFVGNLKDESAQTMVDDGVSQVATARSGVASVGKVVVPNPISLRPYRTFLEVEQQESDFVFRMHEGPKLALFSADGDAWRNTAIDLVAEYLSEKLVKFSKHVTVLA